MNDSPDEAILPDGSVDISKLPAMERARYRLAKDMMAFRALNPTWPTETDALRRFYLEAAGLGPKAIDVVLAIVANPTIVDKLLTLIEAETETDDRVEDQPAEVQDGD